MTAMECEPEVRSDFSATKILTTAIAVKRSIKLLQKRFYEGQKTATSGHSLVIAAILNAQFAYAESADMQALQRQRIDDKGVAATTPEHIH